MTLLDVAIREKRFPGHSGGVGHTALRDLRLQLDEGEFACLVGPSGCGKSTLLNIVNGLDPDYDGRVLIDGTATTEGIGTLFQTPRLMPWLSVLDNVRLVLDDSPEAERHARELLTAMDLETVLQAYPNRLSGGMQRRVALARAFAIRPRLLLLDEPFVSLDAPVADRLRQMLVELWQRQTTTVLFVTHDLREALTLADRVIFLSAAPARVVLDQTVDLPRPRHTEDDAVAALRRRLLRAHPELLAGLVQEPSQA